MYLSRYPCVFVLTAISNNQDCQAHLSSWFVKVKREQCSTVPKETCRSVPKEVNIHRNINALVLNHFKVCETVKEEECQDQLVKR